MHISMSALCRASSFGLLLGAVAFYTASASAGTITDTTTFGPFDGTGPGLGTVFVPAIVTGNPNNDNVVGGELTDNNIFVPIKRFDHSDYIDIEFLVAPDNGVTEYKVFESVDNNTGVNWASYRMELGYGVMGSFTPSTPGDGLDFDTGPPGGNDTPPTSAAFGSVSRPNEDILVFSGGVHSSGAEAYRVRIDVPNIPTMTPFFSRFTLRQTPIPVPEPSTLVLLGVALAGAMAYRSRG